MEPDDLTARARIRQAALEQFSELGFERTTIRGIAAAAGVSLGLVRHHYGSKLELRAAVDEYVLAEIRRAEEEVRQVAQDQKGDLTAVLARRGAMRPFQGYIVRGLLDGSPAIARLFDEVVALTEYWIADSDKLRTDPPLADVRSRAATWTAMVFGPSLLHEHLSRALGADIRTEQGEEVLTRTMLDIYANPLITKDFAADVAAALEGAQHE